MFGEIAEALMDIAFSIFGFDIDIGNLGLTAKGLCDWTKISSSEFGTIAETFEWCVCIRWITVTYRICND